MKVIQRSLILLVSILLVTACTRLPQLALPTEEAHNTLSIIQRQTAGDTFALFLPVIVNPSPLGPPPPDKQATTGGSTMPGTTSSYYMATVNTSTLFNLGCELGLHDLNTTGAQDNLVILDFGYPRFVNEKYTVSLMGYGSPTMDQLGDASRNYGMGYFICSGEDHESHLRIAIGTSNYPGNYNPSITFEHGAAWATMVNDVNYYLAENTHNELMQQVDAVGANDIELSWNSYEATKAWLDGYDSLNQYDLYNYGALPGCGWLKNPDTQCGSYPHLWSKEQIWTVIYGMGPIYPLPEIYLTSGLNAEQWYLLSVYSYQNHGVPVGFVGSLTNYQACQQRGGCSGEGWAIDNTPEQGWSQLYNLLNSDYRTAQGLRWATDILWTDPDKTTVTAAMQTAQQQVAPVQSAENEIDRLRAALAFPNLSDQARQSLAEKLAIAERVETGSSRQVPLASKEFPVHTQLQSDALTLPPLPEEIVEGSEGLLHPSEAAVTNLWRGMLQNISLQALAGAQPQSPEQGLLILFESSPDDMQLHATTYLAPNGVGALRVLARQDNRLVLQPENGQTLYFDLLTRQFSQ